MFWLIWGVASLLALIALGICRYMAPFGYQDENGFHLGHPPGVEDDFSENNC